jgi:hypothetical protein
MPIARRTKRDARRAAPEIRWKSAGNPLEIRWKSAGNRGGTPQ